jgi:hypothetical protein
LQHHTFLARGHFDDLRGRTNRHRFIFCQRLIDHQIEPGQFHQFEPLFGDRKNVWPGRDIQEDEVAGVACGRVVDDVGVLIGKCSRGSRNHSAGRIGHCPVHSAGCALRK